MSNSLRHIKVLIPLAFAIAFTPASWAQSVQGLIHQSLNAHGQPSVKDIEATGATTIDGATVPTTVYVKPGRNIHIENGAGAEHRTVIVNSAGAWVGPDQKVNQLSDNQALRRPEQFPFLDLLSEVDNPNTQLTYRGIETIGTISVIHLTVHLQDPRKNKQFVWFSADEQADFYLDASTLLVVRSTRILSTNESMQIQVPETVDFSSYRNVNGAMIPFRIVTTTGNSAIGSHQSTTVFTKVTVNGGIPDSVFASPKGGK